MNNLENGNWVICSFRIESVQYKILKVNRIKVKKGVGASPQGHVRLCVTVSRDEVWCFRRDESRWVVFYNILKRPGILHALQKNKVENW